MSSTTPSSPTHSRHQVLSTTQSTTVHIKDYDWVLPVVILLAVLIVILFVLVILICRRLGWQITQKRNQHCCDHRQCIELDHFESQHHPSTTRTEYHSPSKTVGHFSTEANSAKQSSRSSELADFKTHYMITNERPNHRSHGFLECNDHSKTTNLSDGWPDDNGETTDVDRQGERRLSYQSFEDNFGENFDTWGDKVNFYLNKSNYSGGISNLAYWDSDSKSVESNDEKDKTDSKGCDRAKQFIKSPSCGKLEVPHNLGALDRQLSNTSAPAYPHGIDSTPGTCRPLGKFQTVHNLSTANDAVEEQAGTELIPHRENVSQLDEIKVKNSHHALKYRIPTIVLPDGDVMDFNDHKQEDNLSFYNSSSLESCVSINSGRSHKRITRANNPFLIEGVNLPRPSSAPCLLPIEQNSQEEKIQDEVIYRSNSVCNGSAPEGENVLLHSKNLISSSSSWSSEFFDLIQDAGTTDYDAQRRMRKMVDDHYHFLFDKKYPELQSLYSKVQSAKRDREKVSLAKYRHCEAASDKKQTSSHDNEGCNRLKPPQITYSEVRPPSRKKNYKERRNSTPNVGNKTLGTGAFINPSFRDSKNEENGLNGDAPVSKAEVREHHDPRTGCANLTDTVYDVPWDLKVKRFGLFHPLELQEDNQNSSSTKSLPIEPHYECINTSRARSSASASPTNLSNLGDKDVEIYERVHDEQRDTKSFSKQNSEEPAESKADMDLPVPPSSRPPQNPNTDKNTSKPKEIKQNTHRSNQNKKDEKTFDEPCECLTCDGLSAGSSVDDFPADTVWRNPGNPDSSFDSEVFLDDRVERTTSFIASSCDTPLEHPSSDEDETNSEKGVRRQSFHKSVMYTHMDENTDDSGEDEDVRSFQRMTSPVEYDESFQISKV